MELTIKNTDLACFDMIWHDWAIRPGGNIKTRPALGKHSRNYSVCAVLRIDL